MPFCCILEVGFALFDLFAGLFALGLISHEF